MITNISEKGFAPLILIRFIGQNHKTFTRINLETTNLNRSKSYCFVLVFEGVINMVKL